MAALATLSAFTYGHQITESNNKIDFNEGAGEITATIDTGSYSLDEFPDAIAKALNAASTTAVFSVSLDRSTRIITISADVAFDLLIASGSNTAFSALALIGFTGISDLTGLLTYDADSVTGLIYNPQRLLQNFVNFEDKQEKAESAVKTSASGDVEVVFYGNVEFMKCEVDFATDIIGQGVIENNATGVSDLREFMKYIIGKHPIEFIPDRDDMNTFTKCILESTKESKEGTAFELKEMYSKGLAYYFETGTLTFRKID